MTFTQMLRALRDGEYVIDGLSRITAGWVLKRVGSLDYTFVPLPEGWVLPI